MTDQQLEELHKLAMDNAELAIVALHNKDIKKFHELSAQAFLYEKQAALGLYEKQIEPSRSVLFRSAAYIALDNADYKEARILYEYAMEGDPPTEIREELNELKIEIDRIKIRNEDFIQTVVIQLRSKSRPLSKEIINEAMQKVLHIFDPPQEINVTYAAQYLNHQFSIDSDIHTTLEEENTYKPWIGNRRGAAPQKYWNRYIQFLVNDAGWAPDTINRLDNITDDVLDHLHDPKADEDWDKRGMVVGQVQSGKTSNYVGLMCKAADYGYRIIIVLAGLNNDLRSQTQFRIDQGFLGWDTKIDRSLKEKSRDFGVSRYDNQPQAHPLTSSAMDGDFSTASKYIVGTNIRGTDPVVMVVKKNGTVLKELIRWLANTGETLSDGKRLIKKLPLLLIDDEADNASVNISSGSVSTINGLIRSLLSLFQQSAYVGYTATPFANVFIPFKTDADNVSKGLNIMLPEFWKYSGEDLFPRDFIINIPPPSNYIGPKEIFGIEAVDSFDPDKAELGLPLLKEIATTDYVEYFPDKHKEGDPRPQDLPSTLKEAIKAFILSCAVRRARGDGKEHNSMLVHVTRFVKWQNTTASLIEKILKSYRQQIQYRQGSLISELKVIYESEYIPVTDSIIRDERFDDPFIIRNSWSEIEPQLNKAASKIQVRAIHGDTTQEGLEYDNITSLDYYDHRSAGLSVIAVGGNKLSRGLTLEGLTISYYLRSSKMYDTLMQMGRWFGYRPGYLDLCRLYTSSELVKWYKYITVASEELRAEFDLMKAQRKSPAKFGIKVREHPDVLKITATNKMRGVEEMALTFSDKLRETWCFERNTSLLEKNHEHTYRFINTLGQPQKLNNQPYVWRGLNNSEYVIQFLKNFIAENMLEHSMIIEYIAKQVKDGFLINWTITLISTQNTNSSYAFIVDNKETSVGLTMRSDAAKGQGLYYEISKSHIIDPLHEFVDFDINGDLYKKALEETVNDWEVSTRRNKKTTPPDIPTGKNIRAQRPVTDGLLLIYPLNPQPQGWKNSGINHPIIGYAISFPKNDNDRRIKYRVNDVFLGEYDYSPELDETEFE
ncbi:MAG: Z1 domain-containing protein [Bacteroidetes bacterium]|nr:Z1 domain-containing protein [Bacteroidota bacterium]